MPSWRARFTLALDGFASEGETAMLPSIAFSPGTFAFRGLLGP